MNTLVTFPGRHGDLLWALPTVRAISERVGAPVDLLIAGEFAGLIPLLARQPYLAQIWADRTWGMGHGWQPPPGTLADAPPYAATYHLGYRRWPERVLPEEVWITAAAEYGSLHPLPPIDLQTPWIQAPPAGPVDYGHQWKRRIAVGFTECYFETKFGLLQLLDQHDDNWALRTVMGTGRWMDEGGEGSCNWEEAAHAIKEAEIFVGDCSALHVLAVALGIPVVLVEPMEARHNDLFYPVGKIGPQVTLVTGLDGQPTFDARHVRETVAQILGPGR
jgi:hypothetical protein